MRFFRCLFVFAACGWLMVSAARAAVLSPSDAAIYDAAFKAADTGNWARALQLGGSASDPLLRDVLSWRYVRASLTDGPGVQTRVDFLRAHPDWPLSGGIRRLIEDQLLIQPHSPAEVIGALTQFPPISANGKRALAQAYLADGRASEAADLFREAWVAGNFSKDNEDRFLAVARPSLTSADHIARTDRLIWEGVYDSAQRMIPRLPNDQALLMQARITLASGKGNATAAVNAVPAHLKSDPGLVFERVRWRRKKDLYDDAIALLRTASPGADHAAPWWREQNLLIRHALNAGHLTQAYRLAADHGHQRGTQATEAEFLAGWIALRFLNDPAKAVGHFSKIHQSVSMPISLSRGAYWAGRAEEARGDAGRATEWYGQAVRHSTTFYGQLAAARLGLSLSDVIVDDQEATAGALSRHRGRGEPLITAARQLAQLDRHDELISFLLAAADKTPDEDVQRALAQIALSAGRPDFAVQIARRGARHGFALVAAGYPMPPPLHTALVSQARANGFPPSVAYGIIRQESNFNQTARSSAGALGLMQILPATAQATAKKEGTDYRLEALTLDPTYNTRLGTRYLGDLLARFDHSLVLAAAGYNAGPGRPARWVNEFGDPRLMKTDDIIDWIERIPFNETRNYVMRVQEGALIYQVRQGERLDPSKPERFLKRVDR